MSNQTNNSPIDIVPKGRRSRPKSDIIRHSLYYNPSDLTQGTYDINMRALCTLSKLEEYCLLRLEIENVIAGRAITNADGKISLTKSILKNDIKVRFEEKVTLVLGLNTNIRGGVTDIQYERIILQFSREVFQEYDLVELVKLIRTAKKPKEIEFKAFIDRLKQLESY